MAGKKKLNTPPEILQVALKKELNARAFYDKILASTRVDYIRNLIEQLRNEEAKHVRLIEKKITDLHLGHSH
jgi:rubrerythrin